MEDGSTIYGFMQMAEMIYNVVAVFFFVLGSTVIINTTMMVIFERMREIGTLSALGMQGSVITSYSIHYTKLYDKRFKKYLIFGLTDETYALV